MQNYFFLYDTTSGEIHSSPYLGYVDEWANIPDGCEVLGPFSEAGADATIKAAFESPRDYIVQGGAFVYRKDPSPPVVQPTETELLQKETTSLRYSDDLISSDLTNLIEMLIEKGVI